MSGLKKTPYQLGYYQFQPDTSVWKAPNFQISPGTARWWRYCSLHAVSSEEDQQEKI